MLRVFSGKLELCKMIKNHFSCPLRNGAKSLEFLADWPRKKLLRIILFLDNLEIGNIQKEFYCKKELILARLRIFDDF